MPAKKSMRLALPVTLLATISACGQPETLRTVDSYCLNARRISMSAPPTATADDPGNAWDTAATILEILESNAVFDRLCPAVKE